MPKKCNVIGCDKPATHVIQAFIPAKGYPLKRDNAIRVIVGNRLCLDHAEAWNFQEFIDCNPKFVDAMNEIGKTHAPPDLSRVVTEVIPISSPEVTLFQDVIQQEKKDLN